MAAVIVVAVLAAGLCAWAVLGVDDARDEQRLQARDARRRETADRLALLIAAGPLDADPEWHAAGADRLLTAAAAAHHTHRKPKGGMSR